MVLSPELLPYKDELMNPDASLYPSYTQLTVPYRVICRQRYSRSGVKHRKQFIKEHKRLELLQNRALDGIRIHKEFCENVLSPPKKDDLINLTPKQETRLLYIMENTII